MNEKKTIPLRGHGAILKQLLDLQTRSRLPHALLFMGPEGIGKRKAALELARHLLCHTGTRCESCPACQLADFFQHPDLELIEPEDGRIKIDTIRGLRRSLSTQPLLGGTRVVVLNDAHAMNTAAANALLKTLEEPPAQTYFILISHAVGWIPRTIVSRSQKVHFSPLVTTDLEAVLEATGRLADKGLSKLPPALLQAAMGSVARALSLMDMAKSSPRFDALLPGKATLAFAEAHEWAQQIGEDEKVLPFLDFLLSAAHHRLTQSFGNADLDLELLAFTDRILEIRRSLRVNANARLHLTRLLMFFQEPLATRL